MLKAWQALSLPRVQRGSPHLWRGDFFFVAFCSKNSSKIFFICYTFKRGLYYAMFRLIVYAIGFLRRRNDQKK